MTPLFASRKTAAALFALLGAAPLAAGQPAGGPGGSGGPPAPFVAVGTVSEEDDFEVRRYPGRVEAVSTVNLTARVSADLVSVGFREGGSVRAGDELFRFDAVRYEAARKNAAAKVAETRTRVDFARRERDRYKILLDENATAKSEYESKVNDFETLEAQLLAAEASLATADDDVKHTRIVAPISGRIGVARVTAGNYVTPSTGTLATVVQVDPLRVRFSLSYHDFLARFGTEDLLKSRAELRLRLANGETYAHDGVVEFLDNQAQTGTDSVLVYARFPNPDGRLLPGATVTVMMARRNGRKVAVVPPSAVMYDQEGSYVYVVDDKNTVERRAVELAGADQSIQRIADGLKAGERVIVEGMHKAMPGGTVRFGETG